MLRNLSPLESSSDFTSCELCCAALHSSQVAKRPSYVSAEVLDSQFTIWASLEPVKKATEVADGIRDVNQGTWTWLI